MFVGIDSLVKPLYNTHINSKEQKVYRLEFSEVRVGRLFHLNGNDYVKQSTRTARMLMNGRVFYVGQREVVHPIAW